MKRTTKILLGILLIFVCTITLLPVNVQASDDEEGPQIDYSYIQEMIDSGELTVDDFIDMDNLTGWATYADDGLEGTTGGGNAKPQLVTDFWDFWELAEDNEPRVIIVAGLLYCPFDTAPTIGRNKTIVGIDENATIEGGIYIQNSSNIIISNLNFKGGWRGTGPEDAILIQNSHHVWLDHLNIWDGRDGNIDIVTGSSYVTVSWCKLWYSSNQNNHRYSCLVGNGAEHYDTDYGRMNVTYHHNWFGENIDRRMPWILYGKGHMYNNYYNSPNNTNCIEVAVYSEALIENNYFKDVNNPHTFLFTHARPASITASGNIYDNTKGVKRTGKAGPNQNSVGYFTDPPYEYTLDAAEDVPNLVMEGAGVRNVVECPYEIVEKYLGDVDMDETVTANDALQVLKYVVKLGYFDETQLTLADADQDMDVDAEDALAILKMVVKLEPLQTVQVIVEKEIVPTTEPTVEPTVNPTTEPTAVPTTKPTAEPTIEPTIEPTASPTTEPTAEPTVNPTTEPTVVPTTKPTAEPTIEPTIEPTASPQLVPELTVPSTYSQENMETPGKVTTIYYKTYDYLGDQQEITKDAYVYLPYGYDETKQYNVVYAMHGVGGTSNEWEIAKNKSLLKKYFDHMICNGDMEPTIFVFPTGRSCAEYDDNSNGGMNSNMQAFYLFGKELRNDLIPYIDENFATYAEYAPGYDLTLAREHRGMVGFSMGGMQTINIGVCECLDIISNFGVFSAAPTTYNASTINQTLSGKFKEYDINLFYNICGSSDSIALSSHKAAMNGLVEGSNGRLIDGENFLWHQVSGGHTMGVWRLGMYNFAKMAF